MDYAILKKEVRGRINMTNGYYEIDYNETPLYEVINETTDEYCILHRSTNYNSMTWMFKKDVIIVPESIIKNNKILNEV